MVPADWFRGWRKLTGFRPAVAGAAGAAGAAGSDDANDDDSVGVGKVGDVDGSSSSSPGMIHTLNLLANPSLPWPELKTGIVEGVDFELLNGTRQAICSAFTTHALSSSIYHSFICVRIYTYI